MESAAIGMFLCPASSSPRDAAHYSFRGPLLHQLARLHLKLHFFSYGKQAFHCSRVGELQQDLYENNRTPTSAAYGKSLYRPNTVQIHSTTPHRNRMRTLPSTIVLVLSRTSGMTRIQMKIEIPNVIPCFIMAVTFTST